MTGVPRVCATKRFTRDVGECNGCGETEGTVTVLGLWPTPSDGRELRLCATCSTAVRMVLGEAATQEAEPTRSLIGSSRPERQGAIARKADTKAKRERATKRERDEAHGARVTHVTPARRKPRKYKAKKVRRS